MIQMPTMQLCLAIHPTRGTLATKPGHLTPSEALLLPGHSPVLVVQYFQGFRG